MPHAHAHAGFVSRCESCFLHDMRWFNLTSWFLDGIQPISKHDTVPPSAAAKPAGELSNKTVVGQYYVESSEPSYLGVVQIIEPFYFYVFVVNILAVHA